MSSFAEDIKPLFRDKDVAAMKFRFDLHDHADVTANAEAILETVEDGSMPCDEPWDEARVDVLRQWIADGCPA